LPHIEFIYKMHLLRMDDMRVLYSAYDRGYSKRVWRIARMETQKDHRYANSYLQAI